MFFTEEILTGIFTEMLCYSFSKFQVFQATIKALNLQN